MSATKKGVRLSLLEELCCGYLETSFYDYYVVACLVDYVKY